MKIIDILNKMANRELEDGFKFCFGNEVYIYTKEDNSIRDKYHNRIGQTKVLEIYLDEEVLLFKDNNQEVIEGNKEIEELEISEKDRKFHSDYINNIADKLNEVINKINKEKEEK